MLSFASTQKTRLMYFIRIENVSNISVVNEINILNFVFIPAYLIVLERLQDVIGRCQLLAVFVIDIGDFFQEIRQIFLLRKPRQL